MIRIWRGCYHEKSIKPFTQWLIEEWTLIWAWEHGFYVAGTNLRLYTLYIEITMKKYILPVDIFLYLKSTAVTFSSLSYLFFRSISNTVLFRTRSEKETKWFLNIGKFRQHLISHLEIAIVLWYSARIGRHYLMAAYRNVVDWNIYWLNATYRSPNLLHKNDFIKMFVILSTTDWEYKIIFWAFTQTIFPALRTSATLLLVKK